MSRPARPGSARGGRARRACTYRGGTSQPHVRQRLVARVRFEVHPTQGGLREELDECGRLLACGPRRWLDEVVEDSMGEPEAFVGRERPDLLVQGGWVHRVLLEVESTMGSAARGFMVSLISARQKR